MLARENAATGINLVAASYKNPEKKTLDKFYRARYNDKALRNQYGRLAQLVAHPLDVREVTSSSLVSSTIRRQSSILRAAVFVFGKPRVRRVAKNRGLCPHMKIHPLGGWMIIGI